MTWKRVILSMSFLSTPSARRATALRPALCGRFRISIHALREEGDVVKPVVPIFCINFYPRPPRGGRQIGDQVLVGHLSFLSTPSARRATTRA